ncbi:NADH-quinone oxidoreductase subunit L [Solitalea sp. MAHUQ-68]|uniref:NADH-quinone oxidoreductase subunit L n=1 Tax=Solitalea agri TaxID=2953739 RepID=A0A9X2F4B4_9SPHI|nr:NADH-quinone oxidoreductase subunit L [Solitalea agri]MCO4293985.1 NADH-quinone oxidoreductase subunit L [Solitalea agri]
MIETQHITTVIGAALGALLLPLLSFLIISFFKPRKGDWLAICSTFISFLLSLYCFTNIWNLQSYHYSAQWLNTGIIKLNAGLTLDNLSALMLVLVTLITTLVLIYSTEYMKGEKYYHRYFAHLSLFMFSMLGVVLADSLLLIYIFWELVGFSSYLLIGFWFDRDSAAAANKKAFIVNRIGDIAFFVGIMILFTQFRTLDLGALFGTADKAGLIQQSVVENGLWKFTDISGNAKTLNASMLTVAGLCIFAGAVAKSAQFPLHVWLPDAMEGPTSVSSLIHAATMVAAGVYLTARVFPLFSPDALTVITYIGAFTAFMAATIALTQNDLKKVLAYSTISQLGFMITALGIGAWQAALFHLVTHAFFKCLLFLGAGSVIHQLHHVQHKYHLDFDPQDMRLMGGLRKQLPVTYMVLLVASLSLAGLPLFSGFLSKDLILIGAWSWEKPGSAIIAVLLSVTSALTAFYIFRMIFKVFWGENRLQKTVENIDVSVHESGKAMTIPMMVLAIFSLFAAFSINPLHGAHSWIYEGLVVPLNSFNPKIQFTEFAESWVPIITVVLAVAMVLVARIAYYKQKMTFLTEHNFLYKFSYNAWYFDKLYNSVIVRSVVLLANFIRWFDINIVDGIVNGAATLVHQLSAVVDWIDRNIVDGSVNGIAWLAARIGDFIRGFQTGRVQQYMALGVFGLILIIVLSYIF